MIQVDVQTVKLQLTNRLTILNLACQSVFGNTIKLLLSLQKSNGYE